MKEGRKMKNKDKEIMGKEYFSTNKENIKIRMATLGDADLIVEYMRKLGEYQKMLDHIVITPSEVRSLLESNVGEVIFIEKDEKAVGFMYFTMKSSAFIGGKVIYIDAMYIDEEARREGIGEKLLQFISTLSKDRGCKRLEWVCLDWNEPAIDLYGKIGAEETKGLKIFRVEL